MVRQFLVNWPGVEIALVMDRTDLNDRLSLLFVGIATEQRVVLLAWEVLPYGGTAADTQMDLLKRIQPLLPDPKFDFIHITLHTRACLSGGQRALWELLPRRPLRVTSKKC